MESLPWAWGAIRFLYLHFSYNVIGAHDNKKMTESDVNGVNMLE